MISDRLQRGWEDWSAQAAKLQIFRVDEENRRKEGHGYYKLNEGSVNAIQADLVDYYRVLVERHSTKIAYSSWKNSVGIKSTTH